MNDKPAVVLETERLSLRPTAPQDLDYVLGLESDPDNAPFILSWSRTEHLDALSDSARAHCILEARDSRTPVGYIILSAIGSPHRSIEFNRITVSKKRQGFGREGLRAVKRLAFDHLGARRLWLDVMSHNHRAASLYRSEGFVEEGTLRECIEVQGRRVSLVILSMLDREYRAS